MFKKVRVGNWTEYECNFGKRIKGQFVNYCTVRASEEQYNDAYSVFVSVDGTAPMTIYRTSLVVYDVAVLKYVDMYLYQPETDTFVRFTPNLWHSSELLDYGTFVGGRLYIFDATVQIHKAGSVSKAQNPLGGLEDEESQLVFTTCHIFIEYL